MFPRPRSVYVVVAILMALAVAPGANAQTYHSGQNLQPVFEGWEQNPDGSFNMVYGYLNRNYEEKLNVPVGPNNFFEPGPLDQGAADVLLSATTTHHLSCPRPRRLGGQRVGMDGHRARAHGSGRRLARARTGHR